MSVNEQMQVVMSGSRNLYPWFPYVYMSLFEYNPDAKVWIFAEDEALPYEVPENVEVVDISGQRIFGEDCANIKTPYTYMSLIRSAWPILFNGKDNGNGIRKLPKLDRVLQLDCDLIVNDTLRPLWDIDMGEAYFAMADETGAMYHPFGRKDADGKRKPYYNCAVAVFELENMRRDGIAEEEIDFLNREKIMCIDQDAHMWTLEKHGYDRCMVIGPRYNECFATTYSVRPAVVHACGVKGWYENLDEQFRGKYWKKYEKYVKEPYRKCRLAGIKC